MKNGMWLKKGVSLLLVFAMVLGMYVPGFAGTTTQTTGSIPLVVLGDGVANGVGLENKEKESFAAQLAELMETADYRLYAENLWRVEEVRYLLDLDYEGDGYTKRFMAEGTDVPTVFQTMRKNKTVINDVAAAENVVLHVGVNNFSSYIVEQMVYWLENGGYLGKTDAVKYEFNFDEFVNTDNEIKIEDTLESVRLAVKDRLLLAAGDDMDKAVELIDFVTEAATYTILSYVKSFNAVANEILTLNPDVNLYVVGIYNPVNDERLSVSINGTTYDSFPMVNSDLEVYDQAFDLGAVFGGLIEIANAYTQVLAPRAYEYTYVHPGDPELLIDQMGDTSIVNEDGTPNYKARISYEFWDQLFSMDGIGVTAAVEELMDMLGDYGLNYTEDEILEVLETAIGMKDTDEREAYLKSLIFEEVAEKAVGKFYLELAAKSDELGTVVPYDANGKALDPAAITKDNAEIVQKIVIVKETAVGDTTEKFSLVINAEKIGNLMDALEAADTDEEYTEAATAFVQDLIAESMVGKTFVGEYIDSKDKAVDALATLETIGEGDLSEMRRLAAEAVAAEIADSDLKDYATTQDIENLLEALDAPSIQSEADQRAVISDWLNGLAARELVAKIKDAGLTYTEEQAKVLLGKLGEETESEREAKAKELLLEDLFHDYMVDAIKGKLVKNGKDLLTLPSYQTTTGTNDYDAFVTAIEEADKDEEAQAIVRGEVCQGIAAECGILGAEAPQSSDVLALFAAADAEKANGEGAQKAVITDWVNTKYNSDPTLQSVSAWQKVVEELCDKFWNGYTASVAAEEAFTTYRGKVDAATKAFSNFVSLRESATDSILKAYADNYKGASSAAQQYANAYIQIRGQAVNSIVEAYKDYKDDIDNALGAVDAFNGYFDKAYEVMCQIAEVDTIHLNDLITVAGRIIDIDENNQPVLNPDYSEEQIETTVTGIAKALVRGDESVKDVKTVAYLALRYILADAVLILPSANGHKTIAEQIKKAMDTGEDVNSTVGGLANRVVDKTIDLYHAAKEFLKLPITASGQDGTLVNPDTYLVFGDNVTSGSALADSTLAYPNVLAGVLAMDENDKTDANDEEKAGDVVGDYTVDGLRAEDLWAQVDGTYKGDAYTTARYGSAIADDNAAYSAQSGDGVDLITVNVGINNLITYPVTQTMLAFNGEETHEMDWGRYIGDDRYALINKGKDIAMGIVLRVVDSLESRQPCLEDLSAYERAERTLETVSTAVESLLYGIVGYIVNLDNAVEDIAAQNPNAVIVLPGFYNPLVGTYVNTGKTVPYYDVKAGAVAETTLPDRNIPIGEAFDYILNQTNRHLTNYVGASNAADEGSRIVTVALNDAELNITGEYGASKDLSVLRDWKTINIKGEPVTIKVPDYLLKANDGSSLGDALHPSVDGHAYIADQILTALDFDIYADVVLESYEIFVGEELTKLAYTMDDESTLFGDGEHLGVEVSLYKGDTVIELADAVQKKGTYTIKAELNNSDYTLVGYTTSDGTVVEEEPADATGAVYTYNGTDDGYTEVEIKYATLEVEDQAALNLTATLSNDTYVIGSGVEVEVSVVAEDADGKVEDETLNLRYVIEDKDGNRWDSIAAAMKQIGTYTITPECDYGVAYKPGIVKTATLTVKQQIKLVAKVNGDPADEAIVVDGSINESSDTVISIVAMDGDTVLSDLIFEDYIIKNGDEIVAGATSAEQLATALAALGEYTIEPVIPTEGYYEVGDTENATLTVKPVEIEVKCDVNAVTEVNGAQIKFYISSNVGDISENKVDGFTYTGSDDFAKTYTNQADALKKADTYTVAPNFKDAGKLEEAIADGRILLTTNTLIVEQYIEHVTAKLDVSETTVPVNYAPLNTSSKVTVTPSIKTATGMDVPADGVKCWYVITNDETGETNIDIADALQTVGTYTIEHKYEVIDSKYQVTAAEPVTLTVEKIDVQVMPASAKVGDSGVTITIKSANVAGITAGGYIVTNSAGETVSDGIAEALTKADTYTLVPLFNFSDTETEPNYAKADPAYVNVSQNGKLTVSKINITPKALPSTITVTVGTKTTAEQIGLTYGAYDSNNQPVNGITVGYTIIKRAAEGAAEETVDDLATALSTAGTYLIKPYVVDADANKYEVEDPVAAVLNVVDVAITATVTPAQVTVGGSATVTISANRDDAKDYIGEQKYTVKGANGEVSLEEALNTAGTYEIIPQFDSDVDPEDPCVEHIQIKSATLKVVKEKVTFRALVNNSDTLKVTVGTDAAAVELATAITGGDGKTDYEAYVKGHKLSRGTTIYTLEQALAKVGTYNVYPDLGGVAGTDAYDFEVLNTTTLVVSNTANLSSQFAQTNASGETVYTSTKEFNYGSMTVDQLWEELQVSCKDSTGNVISGSIDDTKFSSIIGNNFFTLVDEYGRTITDENGSELYGKAALTEALKKVGTYTVKLIRNDNITGEYDAIEWGESAVIKINKVDAYIWMVWRNDGVRAADGKVVQGVNSQYLGVDVNIKANSKTGADIPELRPAAGEAVYSIIDADGTPYSSIAAAAQVPGTYTINPAYVENDNYNIKQNSGLIMIVTAPEELYVVAHVGESQYPVNAVSARVYVTVEDKTGSDYFAPDYATEDGYTITDEINGSTEVFSLADALKRIGEYTVTPDNPMGIKYKTATLNVVQRTIRLNPKLSYYNVIAGVSAEDLKLRTEVTGAEAGTASNWITDRYTIVNANGKSYDLVDAVKEAGTYTITPVPVDDSTGLYNVVPSTVTLTVVAVEDVVIKATVSPSEVIVGTDADQVTVNVRVYGKDNENVSLYAPGVLAAQPYIIKLGDTDVETLTDALAKEGTYTIIPYRGSGADDLNLTEDNCVNAELKVLPKVATFDPFASVSARLDLESRIRVIIDSKIDKEYLDDGIDYLADMGLLVWLDTSKTDVDPDKAYIGAEGSSYYTVGTNLKSSGVYSAYTLGIPAKEYGDVMTLRLFVKLPNGQYAYGKLFEYSVSRYAYNLQNDARVGETCKALLNYGACAQLYFDYKTENLVNAQLSEKDQAMETRMQSAYGYLDTTTKPSAEKTQGIVENRDVFESISVVLQLDGSTNIKVLFKIADGITEKVSEKYLYYWTSAQYQECDTLKFIENQKINIEFQDPDKNGKNAYVFYSERGTAAKDLGEGVYFCGYVKTTDGKEYYSPVFVYSVETYAQNMWDKGNYLGDLMQRLTVYGQCAKEYFGN